MKYDFSRYKKILLLIILVYNSSIYWGSRLIAQGMPHYYFGLDFEKKIPLIPWTIYIYLGCYLFWSVNYLLALAGNKEETYRFALAELTGKTVCFLFYVFLPTTMPRPEIIGTGFANDLLRNLYLRDAADNLLPSIHCLVSWYCFIAAKDKKYIPVWYKACSCLMALAVCISTLTVKQHVLVDVFAGILLAEITYCISGKIIHKYFLLPDGD